MYILFDNYLTWMSTEVGQILTEAVTAQKTLEQIKKKFQTIHGTYNEGKHAAERDLEELANGTLWRRIFGGNTVNIERQRRAINDLDEFIRYNILFLNNVGLTITKIKEYQSQTKKLQETKISPGPLEVTLDTYLKQIQGALTRLTKSKEDFDGKIQQSQQLTKTEL
jgi:hypothetical protein